MTAPPDTDPGQVRPFADVLRELGRGSTHSELSEGLRDLVAHVAELGKGGSLTYSLTVKPQKNGDGVLVVEDRIALKLPLPERKASIFYADDLGNLTREDPRQLTFDGALREVAAADETTALREARA